MATTATLLGDHTATGQIFSNGWVEAPQTVDVIEPATGEVIGVGGIADAVFVAKACAGAARAQPDWAAVEPAERAAVMERAAELLAEHQAELEGWIIRESGSTQPKAEIEIRQSIAHLRAAAALLEEPFAAVLPTAFPGRHSVARRLPVGVVAVISPWNFPVILSMRSVAPALAFGNAVVLKADPETPIVGGVLFARIFEEAGLPDGVLHVFAGGAEAGQALAANEDVDMIAFTGSTAAGRAVGETAGRTLKRVALELGGNSPLVVLDDADVELASSAGAFGSFLHQGQICMAVGRHLVHEAVVDEYVRALVTRAERLPVGDPAGGQVALGPIINQRQVDRIQRIVDESVAAGAILVTGGVADGLFYPPTVLRDCHPVDAGVRRGDLRPDRGRHDLQRRRRGGAARERDRLRPRGSGAGHAGARRPHRRTASGRHGARERPDGERGGSRPVRRVRQLGQRRELRRPREPRRIYDLAVADDPRDRGAVPVLAAADPPP